MREVYIVGNSKRTFCRLMEKIFLYKVQLKKTKIMSGNLQNEHRKTVFYGQKMMEKKYE